MAEQSTPRMVGTAEGARELDIDESYLRRVCRQGRIQGAVRIGGSWLMPSPVEVLPARRSRGRPRADAGLGTASSEASDPGADVPRGLTVVDLDLILPHPYPTRTGGDVDRIDRLARDIRGRGLLDPIVVRPVVVDDGVLFEVVSGSRRLQAVRILASKGRWDGGIPAIVREIPDPEVFLATLAREGQRVAVDVVTEARAIEAAFIRHPELRRGVVARAMGITVEELEERRRLLRLPEPVLDRVVSGEMLWPGPRVLLSVVGRGHRHDPIVLEVIKELLSSRWPPPPWDALVVGQALDEVVHDTDWEQVPDPSQAPWLERCLDELPTHRPAFGGIGGASLWTCEPDLLRVAEFQHQRAEQLEQFLRDPVIGSISPAITDLDGLSTSQREEVGTRMGPVPAGAWSANIRDEVSHDIATYFGRQECENTCTWGAVFTTDGIVCTTRDCFDRKLEEAEKTRPPTWDEVLEG